jgi:hypothetical protein
MLAPWNSTGDPHRAAPDTATARHLRLGHRERLHLGDDGRVPDGGRQDPGHLRVQRRGDPERWWTWPTGRGSASRGNWGSWATSRATPGRRRTATAPRGCFAGEDLLTDPDQAAEFVRQTGVDALAVAIGTSHGAYKFTSRRRGGVLAMDRIEEIHRRLPNTHLVMHGPRRCPRTPGPDQPVRRPDEADLRSAHRGDPAGHSHACGRSTWTPTTDGHHAAIRKVFAETPRSSTPGTTWDRPGHDEEGGCGADGAVRPGRSGPKIRAIPLSEM